AQGSGRRLWLADLSSLAVRLRFALPVGVIQVGKEIILGFHASEPGFVNAIVHNLRVDSGEPTQVLLDTPARILGVGVRAHKESPIAGLGQEQLAGGLAQGALGDWTGPWEAISEFRQAFLGDLEVGINPLVFLIEPHAPVT